MSDHLFAGHDSAVRTIRCGRAYPHHSHVVEVLLGGQRVSIGRRARGGVGRRVHCGIGCVGATLGEAWMLPFRMHGCYARALGRSVLSGTRVLCRRWVHVRLHWARCVYMVHILVNFTLTPPAYIPAFSWTCIMIALTLGDVGYFTCSSSCLSFSGGRIPPFPTSSSSGSASMAGATLTTVLSGEATVSSPPRK